MRNDAVKRWPLMLGFILATAAGCSSKKSIQDFTPATSDARKALEIALTSWKAGEAIGTVPGSSKPSVWTVDSDWRSGKKLREFEIIGEEPAGESLPRTFRVRLTLDGAKPREVKYMVQGIDPLGVYRDTDYDSLSGAGK